VVLDMAHADELRGNVELSRRAVGHRTEDDRKIDRTLIASAESLECEGEARGNRGGIPPGKDLRDSSSASAFLVVFHLCWRGRLAGSDGDRSIRGDWEVGRAERAAFRVQCSFLGRSSQQRAVQRLMIHVWW
jgi:hypothetical protein